MEVIFKPQQYCTSERGGSIAVKGTFEGLGIDFLAVMARLYELPFLWFSEGISIEIDFEAQKLFIKAPEGSYEDFHAKEVVEEIPLRNLVCLPVTTLRSRYVSRFAANIAEYNFNMPKTAQAIRQDKHPALILELATEEGHPVLDAEIENLLFREKWGIETSYQPLVSTLV